MNPIKLKILFAILMILDLSLINFESLSVDVSSMMRYRSTLCEISYTTGYYWLINGL